MTITAGVPVASHSIWKPIHLGTDETGKQVHVNLAERNMLIGGEPGGGKSVALQLIVAHAALSGDCKLILIDGKRVELGLWAEAAERFVGPSIDDAIDVMHGLQHLIDERTDVLLQMRKRKVTPDLGWPFYLVPIDEVAYFSATVGTLVQQKEFNAANRDVVARGRAPGIIPVEATQRPSADIIPTSLRDLFGYRWAFRCSTEASSDTILGHGWADKGYSATEIDPQARGVSWLRAEDGIPRRVKAAYLSDEEIIYLASHAATAQTKATHQGAGKVVTLRRKGDAAWNAWQPAPSRFTVKPALTPKRRRRVIENDEYAAFVRRAIRAYSRRVANGDIDAITDLITIAADLAAIDHAVRALHNGGYSWADIAARLGITRQAAQQRWGNGKPATGTLPPR